MTSDSTGPRQPVFPFVGTREELEALLEARGPLGAIADLLRVVEETRKRIEQSVAQMERERPMLEQALAAERTADSPDPRRIAALEDALNHTEVGRVVAASTLQRNEKKHRYVRVKAQRIQHREYLKVQRRRCAVRVLPMRANRHARAQRVQRTAARRAARKATADPPSEPDSSASLRSSAEVAS